MLRMFHHISIPHKISMNPDESLKLCQDFCIKIKHFLNIYFLNFDGLQNKTSNFKPSNC